MLRTLFLLMTLSGVPVWQDQENFHSASLLQVAPPPILADEYTLPYLETKAFLVMDINSGMTLMEKNSNDRLSMASLTKIMTAVIILEENDLDEKVQINMDFSDIEGSRAYLYQNETLTVRKLLLALLIPSGNDAAKALAIHNAGSVAEFVKKMNQRAKELGLNDTHFTNPMGYDHAQHYSTARDMAFLTLFALKDPFFRKTVQISQTQIVSENGQIVHNLKNTNKLLDSYLNIKGIKTGTTDEAGECLITLLEVNNQHDVLTVMLNSPQRFQETKILLDNVIKNYKW